MYEREELRSLDVLASLIGVDLPTLVGMMSAVHRGISNRDSELGSVSGTLRLPALNLGLIDDVVNVERFLDRLIMRPRRIQQVLLERFGRIDLALLSEAFRAEKGMGLGFVTPGTVEIAQREFQSELLLAATSDRVGPVEASYGGSDLTGDELFRRLEFLVRPRCLVEKPSAGQLKSEIGQLHRGSGLVIGGSALRIDRLVAKEHNEVVDALDGFRQPIPEILTRGYPGATEEAIVTMVLQGSLEGWGGAGEIRDRVLLLRAERRMISEEVDPRLSGRCLQLWERYLHTRLNELRWGKPIEFRFGTPEERLQIERETQEYEQDCRAAGIRAASVLHLPESIMVCLSGFLEDVPCQTIWSFAVDQAVVLRDRHVRLEREIRALDELERVVVLAGKLLASLARKNNLATFRDITRGFHRLGASESRPVMEMMERTGLLEKVGEKQYKPGPEKDVRMAMRTALREEPFRFVA